MDKRFPLYKTNIESSLRIFFQQKSKELALINQWGSDGCKRYELFTIHGKMIRGSLTILGYEMFGQKASPEVVKAAAAMEIFQSALLIHDDIMDRDTTRRGMNTIFAQYQLLGDKQNVFDSKHFGESMGICVGDIGFFLAFEILSALAVEPSKKDQVLTFVSNEYTTVGLAQMQDVSISSFHQKAKEKDVVSLYRYKTARYTFSLPLMIGAILAGQPKETVNILESLGEYLGVIFQLVDDTLDKDSDMREGKQTLLALWGETRTKKEISTLNKKAEHLITKLPVDHVWQRILSEFLEYNRKRTI